MYVYVCMYVCMYVRTHACVYVYVRICAYVCMHVVCVRTYACGWRTYLEVIFVVIPQAVEGHVEHQSHLHIGALNIIGDHTPDSIHAN